MTRSGHHLAVVGAVVTATCLGCAGATETSNHSSPASVAAPDAIDIGLARAATVEITVRGCGAAVRHGTGTVIDGSGLVLTAAHVVAGAATIEIGVDDTTVGATVVHFDPELDLAALRANQSLGNPVPLRPAPATAGEHGIVVISGTSSHREVVDVEVVRTATIRTTDIYLDAHAVRPGFEIGAAIETGDSGAMVHLPGGGVGIVWARSTLRADRAWAVDIPGVVADPTQRAALTSPVHPGPCP